MALRLLYRLSKRNATVPLGHSRSRRRRGLRIGASLPPRIYLERRAPSTRQDQHQRDRRDRQNQGQDRGEIRPPKRPGGDGRSIQGDSRDRRRGWRRFRFERSTGRPDPGGARVRRTAAAHDRVDQWRPYRRDSRRRIRRRVGFLPAFTCGPIGRLLRLSKRRCSSTRSSSATWSIPARTVHASARRTPSSGSATSECLREWTGQASFDLVSTR